MSRLDGSLARTLDFGDITSTANSFAGAVNSQRGSMRLAPRPRRLSGPDKYRILERRRRDAQMRARRLLDVLDAGGAGL